MIHETRFGDVSLSTDFSGQYIGYFNTRQYQGNQKLQLGVVSDFGRKDQDQPEQYTENSQDVEFHLSGRSENRFYLGKLRFVEADFSLHRADLAFRNQYRNMDSLDRRVKRVKEYRDWDGSILFVIEHLLYQNRAD